MLLIAVLLSACPPKRVSFGAQGEAKSVDELLARITAAENTVISLKGDGKLGVDSPQGKGSVAIFAAALHPQTIHFEQLDFFGRPQGVLTTDGETFGLYDGASSTFFRGPASAQNLGRFLPLVIPPRELVSLLLGRAPRIPHEKAELTFDTDKNVYRLTLHRGVGVQVLEVAPDSNRVLSSRIQNINAYDVEFADLELLAGVTVPKKITLNSTTAKTRLELSWKEIAVNEAPDLTMFDMTPPENVPVVEVDAEGKTVTP